MGALLERGRGLGNEFVFLTMVVIGCFLLFAILRRALRMATQEPVTVKARVVDKHDIHKKNYTSSLSRDEQYEVAFDTGGLILRFKVNQEEYAVCRVGQKGKLTYQGKEFVRFLSD